MDDDEPWFCCRCKLIVASEQNSTSQETKINKAITLPNCFLCPDLRGAMIDLQTKDWVHHTCVNWHNEIWFEEEDTKLQMFGGSLNYERFELRCYICHLLQGSCIQCDFKQCRKAFHVRCAINEKLIVSNQEMEELRLSTWDIKVFCHQHTECGKQRVQKLQLHRFLSSNCDDQMQITADDEGEKDERITRRSIMNQQQQMPSRKRQSVINDIDVDRFMTEDFEREQQQLLFGCDVSGDNIGFRARKSKTKIVPDPDKCKIFSLANLMQQQQELSLPEKKPGTFQMPILGRSVPDKISIQKPIGQQPTQKQTQLVNFMSKQIAAAPSKKIESVFGSDPRLKALAQEQGASLTRGQVNDTTNRPLEKQRNHLSINDITIQSDLKFKIDEKLAEVLHMPNKWCTYREFTLALFKFHKTVGNFYDKPTQTFELSKYPVFRRWWPNHQRIGSDDIKTFLLGNSV